MTEDVALLRRLFRDVPACRVATVRADGGPHVAARWFVWLEDAVWVSTRIGDQTWENATADPRIAVLIDRGRDWNELAGARVQGVAELLPRPARADVRLARQVPADVRVGRLRPIRERRCLAGVRAGRPCQGRILEPRGRTLATAARRPAP